MLIASMLRLRSGLLTRLVVVALLSWAATDLVFPELCAEDSALAAQSQGSANDASARQDDCFCCCQHVVPVILQVSTVHLGSIDLPDAQPPVFPVGIVRHIFHPPLAL